MTKACMLVGIVSFILVFISGLINSVCCFISPVLGVILGLASGFMCAFWEQPADSEKAAMRGALTGAVVGGVALVAQTLGQSIAGYITLIGQQSKACLSIFCNLASTPMDQTGSMISYASNACFCGLMLLAIMSAFGGLGGILWCKTSGAKTESKTAPLP
jgi:hypothetical protein